MFCCVFRCSTRKWSAAPPVERRRRACTCAARQRQLRIRHRRVRAAAGDAAAVTRCCGRRGRACSCGGGTFEAAWARPKRPFVPTPPAAPDLIGEPRRCLRRGSAAGARAAATARWSSPRSGRATRTPPRLRRPPPAAAAATGRGGRPRGSGGARLSRRRLRPA